MLICKVTGDVNDADYISTEFEFKDPEDKEYGIEFLKKVAAALALKDGNWTNPEKTYNGILTEKEIDAVHNMIPHGHGGIHSIESIELYEKTNPVRIF